MLGKHLLQVRDPLNLCLDGHTILMRGMVECVAEANGRPLLPITCGMPSLVI